MTHPASRQKSQKSQKSEKSEAKRFWSSVKQQQGDIKLPDDSRDTKFRIFFWGAQIRATAPRMAVLHFLADTGGPVPLPTLIDGLSARYGVASIYRALPVLEKAGFVERGSFGDQDPSRRGAYYELRLGSKHHHHAICTSCGELEDVPCDAPALHTEANRGLKNFACIKDHSLEYFGLCKRCAA